MRFLFDRVEDARRERDAFGVFLDGDFGALFSDRRDRVLGRARVRRFFEIAQADGKVAFLGNWF